jgi:hypothetical protein
MQTRVESFVLFRFHFFSCLFFIFTTDDLMLRERGQRLSICDTTISVMEPLAEREGTGTPGKAIFLERENAPRQAEKKLVQILMREFFPEKRGSSSRGSRSEIQFFFEFQSSSSLQTRKKIVSKKVLATKFWQQIGEKSVPPIPPCRPQSSREAPSKTLPNAHRA